MPCRKEKLDVISQRISLKHLRAFRAVAHHQHFTRAAEDIGLSQPALSALVAQLEEDLSVQLLNRTTRAVELTPIGREFLISATRVLGEMNNAILEVKDHTQLRRGRLRIAALPSLCTVLLPKLIRRFHALYEGVVISVLDLPSDEILNLALARQIDFGISHAGPNDPHSFESILTDRLVAVASHALMPEAPVALSWNDLAKFELIAMSHGTSVRRLIDEGLHRSGAELRIILEPRQMPTAIAYARAGLGVAILPSSGIPADLGQDMLCAAIIDPVVERQLSIIRASDGPLGPPAERFLDLLREEILARGQAPN